MRRTIIRVGLAAASLILAACSNGSGEVGSSTTETPNIAQTVATNSPTATSCELTPDQRMALQNVNGRVGYSMLDIGIEGARLRTDKAALVVSPASGPTIVVLACAYNEAKALLVNVASRTPTPLAWTQSAQIQLGLTFVPIALSVGSCDNGPALLLEAEITNDTASYRRDVPTIVVRSPDNQELLNFTGFSDHPNFYSLPQGLPPNSRTRAFYCFGYDGSLGRGTYVGPLPASFTGWQIDSQVGPLWRIP